MQPTRYSKLQAIQRLNPAIILAIEPNPIVRRHADSKPEIIVEQPPNAVDECSGLHLLGNAIIHFYGAAVLASDGRKLSFVTNKFPFMPGDVIQRIVCYHGKNSRRLT